MGGNRVSKRGTSQKNAVSFTFGLFRTRGLGSQCVHKRESHIFPLIWNAVCASASCIKPISASGRVRGRERDGWRCVCCCCHSYPSNSLSPWWDALTTVTLMRAALSFENTQYLWFLRKRWCSGAYSFFLFWFSRSHPQAFMSNEQSRCSHMTFVEVLWFDAQVE